MLGSDYILDQEAFDTAIQQLQTLAEEMHALKSDIEALLAELAVGFDTPAGHKFFAACGSNLTQPMEDQCLVLQHVSENLRTANQRYETVFDEYAALNRQISRFPL